jgi:hypothetical protein
MSNLSAPGTRVRQRNRLGKTRGFIILKYWRPDMLVRSRMTPDVHTASPDTTLAEAQLAAFQRICCHDKVVLWGIPSARSINVGAVI